MRWRAPSRPISIVPTVDPIRVRPASVMIQELFVPDWPPEFACSTTVPLERSPTAHTEAGRRVALHALGRVAGAVVDLPPRTGRRPAWPDGFVGSIAHDDAMAIAVAARVEATSAVGIDVELHDALSPSDASLVMRDDELDFVGADPTLATLLWSAKESAYKAWCNGLGVELDRVDPRDIHIGRLDTSRLVARAVGDLAPRVAAIGPLQVRWGRVGELVLTLAWRAKVRG